MLRCSLRASLLTVFSVAVTTSALAQGELCSTAVPVTPGTYTADGPATGGGASLVCWGANATNADWYSYSPGGAGTWEIGSCDGGTDTRVSVYSGVCGALLCLGQGEDDCQMGPGLSNFASQVLGLAAVPGETYYIEWDDRWTGAGFDWYLNFYCAGAPSSTYDVVPDCANGTFSVDVTITNLGTASDVNITNTGGAPTISGVGLGTYTVGPFALGTQFSYSIVNNQDPGCDAFSATITNFPCPYVSCGPDNYTYCYGDNEETFFVYQSATNYPIAMIFNSGTMFTWDDDSLFIYDGDDDQAPVLYAGNGDINGDFTGLLRVSTNPDNILTLKIQSGQFTSCANFGGQIELNYDVACLDCFNPAATFTVVPDCPHRQYSVQVNLTGTGNATDADISNSLNSDTLQNVAAGTYTIGPFGNDTSVVIGVQNGLNNLCRIFSNSLVNTDSSCIINSCDVNNVYCYTNNDEAWWVYQAAVPGPITVEFFQGEMLAGDKVVVYNGFDDLSAVLFNGNNGGDMTGVTVNSVNPDNALAIRVLGDIAGSCQGGQVDDDLSWNVRCGAVDVSEEPMANDFVLFPNPSTGVLNIGLNHQWTGPVQLNVTDLSGRLVFSGQMNVTGGGSANTIDLGNLSNGQYAVQLTTDRWTQVKQIQVQR